MIIAFTRRFGHFLGSSFSQTLPQIVFEH